MEKMCLRASMRLTCRLNENVIIMQYICIFYVIFAYFMLYEVYCFGAEDVEQV